MSLKNTFLVVLPISAGREDLENKGKILLPSYVLEQVLQKQNLSDVMTFILRNPQTDDSIAAGVESFISDPASCIIPTWMLNELHLLENDKVEVSYSNISKGKSVTFQPLNEDFNKISNPKAVLEYELRNHVCLTVGTILPIVFNRKNYFLKVLHADPQRMISIVNTDLITEFAAPLSSFTHHWGEEEECHEAEKPKQAFVGKPHSLRE